MARRGLVVEDVAECGCGLDLIIDGELMKKPLVEPLLLEANEPIAIMVAAHKTTQSKIKG